MCINRRSVTSVVSSGWYCDGVSVSYKQCIKVMESSAYVSLPDLQLVSQKCDEAVMCSRRLHAQIQSKYDATRANTGPKHSSNVVPVVTGSSSSSYLISPRSSWFVTALTNVLLISRCIQFNSVWLYSI